MISLLSLFLIQTQEPEPVYRIDMAGPGNLESWAIDHRYEAAGDQPVVITASGPGGESRQSWPSATALDANLDGSFSLVAHYPKSLQVETFSVRIGDAETVYRPVRYEQENQYILPLAGNAIISRGVFNNNGHGWHRSRFAYDFLGLSATYGPMTSPEYRNENLAGFGMDVIAPANGVVVFIEDRLPDQEGGYDGDKLKLPDGSQAYHGNTVIIDHGNGEYISLMHLKAGSINVAVGDEVRQGQKLAELGNSGDSTGPHLHVQLQHCPLPQDCKSVPLVFANHGSEILVGGDFITYQPVASE